MWHSNAFLKSRSLHAEDAVTNVSSLTCAGHQARPALTRTTVASRILRGKPRKEAHGEQTCVCSEQIVQRAEVGMQGCSAASVCVECVMGSCWRAGAKLGHAPSCAGAYREN